MSIVITTLNNEAAVAKTFTKIAGDRAQTEYYNSTDATSLTDGRLIIKQQLVGKQNGIPLRRSLVQSSINVIDGTTGVMERVVANLTLTTPTSLQNVTVTQRKDLVAYLRNLLTAAVVEQLAFGEL